jgi:hypothetical protein
MILPISAFQVGRIIGVRYLCPICFALGFFVVVVVVVGFLFLFFLRQGLAM